MPKAKNLTISMGQTILLQKTVDNNLTESLQNDKRCF